MARAAIGRRGQGVVPILVGGGGAHIRAIVDRFDFQGTDPVDRQKWRDELDHIGAPALQVLPSATRVPRTPCPATQPAASCGLSK